MKRIFFGVWFLIVPLTLSAANFTVLVKGLRNDKGAVVLEIYKDSASFEKRNGPVKRFEDLDIKDGQVTISIPVEKGRYAISLFHDEDRNKKFRFNSFKQPVEGWGTSKNHRGFPTFEEVATSVGDADIEESITVLYAQKVVFTVQGVRNMDGYLMLGIYNNQKTFLKPNGTVAGAIKIEIPGEQVRIEFMLLPGNYAASVAHDENGNVKLDTNFFGIPKEGYGFSRDAKGSFGPPKFKDAAFFVGSELVEQKMTMNY